MRREIINEENKLMYGDDHIEGMFYKVTSADGTVLEQDSKMFNPKLTITLIAEFVAPYGFDLSAEVPEVIIED